MYWLSSILCSLWLEAIKTMATLILYKSIWLGNSASCYHFKMKITQPYNKKCLYNIMQNNNIIICMVWQNLGIRENYCVWVCQESSTPSFFWQIFVFTYLIMLQIMGIVLAFQTRKVRLRGLRDSKYVAAIIYISSISIVVMALVTFALENYINVGTGILSVGIFLLTTMFLVLIFVPKVTFLQLQLLFVLRKSHGYILCNACM